MLVLKHGLRLLIENSYVLMICNFTQRTNHELRQKSKTLEEVEGWPFLPTSTLSQGAPRSYSLGWFLPGLNLHDPPLLKYSLKQRKLTTESQRVSLVRRDRIHAKKQK